MSINFTAEQEMIRKSVIDFAKKDVAPIAYEIDRDEIFPAENFKKLGELDMLGITVPEEYGGAGYGYTEMCIVIEELAKVCISTSAVFASHADLCVDNLCRNGNEEQKKKYLPGLCSAKLIGGLAMTEPEAGSDVMSMGLYAEKKGNEYILNGTKIFITNGPIGDIFIVYAKTDTPDGSQRVTAFIVEKEFEGFEAGKKYEKMGWRGSPTGELIFNNCRVPEKNILGKEGMGGHILMSGLNTERIVMAAQAVGLAKGAFEYVLNYAKERKQFGKSLTEFQMIQGKLADMSMEIELGHLISYHGAALADNYSKGPALTDKALRKKMNLVASHAKLFTSEMVMRVTTEAVQMMGGYGYMKEFPVERMMRDAKLSSIGGGTSEIQRLIIARELIS